MKYKILPALFVMLFFSSCSIFRPKKDVSTKPLFWNSQRVNIDKTGEDIPLQEEISYTQTVETDTTQAGLLKHKPLSETQDLKEVTITSRRKTTFVPASGGRVKIRFRIDVPKEVLNDDWRLEITPNVIVSDTVISLANVYIKGTGFLSSQKAGYDNYNDYLHSIVPKEKYDSAFFDRSKAEFALNRVLNQNYANYTKRFNKQKRIKTWFSMQGARYHEEKMKQRAGLEKQKSFYNILVKDRMQHEYNAGRDTTGMYNRYMGRMLARIADFENKGDSMYIADKYKALLYGDYPENRIFTRQDSIDLAQDFYMRDKILLNEDKAVQAGKVKKRLIPYFYEENYKCDTIVQTGEDFSYIYEAYIPITKKTKNLKVFVRPTVHGADISRFNLETSDTVTYIISSLAQLADPSLRYKKTTIHKTARNRYTPQFTFAKNSPVFDIADQTNLEEARKIINECNVFTDKGGYIIDSIEIYSYTAPSGQWEKNAALSRERAGNIKAYFNPRINTTFSASGVGEDWNMLARLVKTDNSIENKEAILGLLTTATNPDLTIADIKKKYPKDWNHITSSLFPQTERIEMYVNLHHPDAKDSTENIITKEEEIPGYDKALRFIRQREYWQALEILKSHTDYNTALCLVALGYNDKAMEVLDLLPQTPDTEYLRALVYVRRGEKENAVESLRTALKLDNTKLSRFRVDTEINTFCINNNLYNTFSQ